MDLSADTKRLTWRRCAGIVLAVMIVGTLAAIQFPYWFKPPNFTLSGLLQALLTVLWIPVLIFLIMRRPQGSRWIPLLLLLVGLIPVSIGGFLWARGAILDASGPSCKVQDLSDGTTRYICNLAFFGDSTVIAFEGVTGSPFVRLVDTSTCQGSGCNTPVKP